MPYQVLFNTGKVIIILIQVSELAGLNLSSYLKKNIYILATHSQIFSSLTLDNAEMTCRYINKIVL